MVGYLRLLAFGFSDTAVTLTLFIIIELHYLSKALFIKLKVLSIVKREEMEEDKAPDERRSHHRVISSSLK